LKTIALLSGAGAVLLLAVGNALWPAKACSSPIETDT